jgi:hypothetical protein
MYGVFGRLFFVTLPKKMKIEPMAKSKDTVNSSNKFALLMFTVLVFFCRQPHQLLKPMNNDLSFP